MATNAKKMVEKVYRLTNDRSGLTFTLNSGRNHNLTVNDAKGLPQANRHCTNEKSIYVKMQSDHAKVVPIVFMGGYIEVPPHMQITQAFLDAHPGNTINGGSKFEFVDDEQHAKDHIAIDETKVDIKYAIRQKSKEKDGIHALKQVASVIKGSVIQVDDMGIEELKELLYNETDRNYKYFIDDAGSIDVFEDEYLKRKYLTLRAIRAGILKESSDRKAIQWASNSQLIFAGPIGQPLNDAFAEFLGTDDGIVVLESISKKL